MPQGQLLAYRPWFESDQSGLGAETIEAWPAAGGGLLVGVAEPVFAAAAPLRRSVKTVFIRIGDGDIAVVMLPYVTLEDEVRDCIRVLVAVELSVPEHRVEIRAAALTGAHHILDLSPLAERSLQACAAVARTLLISAAAENWGQAVDLCRGCEGAVLGPDRIARYGAIAADAALCDLPRSVRLLCGHEVPLASELRDGLAFAD
jgi:hypothetical protein